VTRSGQRAKRIQQSYKTLALLPYASLALEFRKGCPFELRAEITDHAAAIQARKGEQYQVSTCGQAGLRNASRNRLRRHSSHHPFRRRLRVDGGSMYRQPPKAEVWIIASLEEKVRRVYSERR
jgi:hypothetical protein